MTEADSEQPPRVLLLDDEPANLDTFKRVFRRSFKIWLASSGSEALKLVRAHTFDVALVDYSMPDMTGIEFIRAARAVANTLPFVLITAFGDVPEVQEAARELGVVKILLKPWREEDVNRWVKHSISMARMRASVTTLLSQR